MHFINIDKSTWIEFTTENGETITAPADEARMVLRTHFRQDTTPATRWVDEQRFRDLQAFVGRRVQDIEDSLRDQHARLVWQEGRIRSVEEIHERMVRAFTSEDES